MLIKFSPLSESRRISVILEMLILFKWWQKQTCTELMRTDNVPPLWQGKSTPHESILSLEIKMMILEMSVSSELHEDDCQMSDFVEVFLKSARVKYFLSKIHVWPTFYDYEFPIYNLLRILNFEMMNLNQWRPDLNLLLMERFLTSFCFFRKQF